MYAIKACEEWKYGWKPRVSGSDFGLGLWRRVVGRVDAGFLKDPGAFIVRGARSEQSQKTWVFSSTAVRNSENSHSAAVLFLKLGTRWKWVATFILRPPYFAGRTTQYQGRSGRFGEVHSADERAWRSGRGPDARCVAHIFVFIGSIIIFPLCRLIF